MPEFQLSVHHDWLLFDAANGENPRFGRVDDRGELVDAQHAEVRDGERRPCVLLGHQLALTSSLGKVASLLGNLPQRQAIGVEQDGRDEAVFDGYSHSDVDAIELADLVGEPVRIDLGMLRQCERDRFDHYVVERRLVLIAHLGELGAHFGGTCRIEFSGEEKRRDGTVRLQEPARDRLSDLRQRDVLEVAFGREPLGCGGPCGTARRLGVFDVALDDAAARSGALNSSELDSFIARESSREW